jgi:hypothetical protein
MIPFNLTYLPQMIHKVPTINPLINKRMPSGLSTTQQINTKKYTTGHLKVPLKSDAKKT